ncbi:aminoacyl-tRNA hydrolase [Demequina oxidasica]|uniref:aminoacyl-tRNA hydrolase n=1 Tax=Demequina oxidasica TaxID=676199 RepID=UPI0007855E88
MCHMSALVIGLGNPGPEYAETRHNIGQMVIAELARAGGASLSANRKVNARVAQVRIGGIGPAGVSATVATPSSYMNVSGGPVSALAKYLSVEPTEVVVVHDELDIPFGTIKLKRGGGSGGHNGLKDITKALGTPDYVRVRVGVGRPPGRMDAAAFVLKAFSSTERKELPMLISDGADAVEAVVVDGLEAAQLRFHTK